jgi:hypothetical protein
LVLLASKIRQEVCGIWDSFLSFSRKYIKKKTHNMLSLMLNPRFKSICIISSFVGREQGVIVILEYEMKSLYPMLINTCIH